MKHVKLRIGQPILCGKCGEDRLFGYGPCRSCGDVPNANAVNLLRVTGVVVGEDGRVVRQDDKAK